MRRFFTDRTPPTAEQLAETYDSLAPEWLGKVGRAETLMIGEKWRNDMASQLRGNVLEIGVAAGDTLIRLRSQNLNVTSYTGIDISAGMIDQAQQAAVGLDLPVTLLQTSAEHMPMFADNQFDTVVASLVFCTVADVPKALAEVARVCKPDGQFVSIEHVLAPNPLVAKAQRLFAPAQIRHIGCRLDRQTDQVLRDHGFRIHEERRRWFSIFRFIVASPPSDMPGTLSEMVD